MSQNQRTEKGQHDPLKTKVSWLYGIHVDHGSFRVVLFSASVWTSDQRKQLLPCSAFVVGARNPLGLSIPGAELHPVSTIEGALWSWDVSILPRSLVEFLHQARSHLKIVFGSEPEEFFGQPRRETRA
jgi:hypothetical protein